MPKGKKTKSSNKDNVVNHSKSKIYKLPPSLKAMLILNRYPSFIRKMFGEADRDSLIYSRKESKITTRDLDSET